MGIRSEMTLGEFVKLKRTLQDQLTNIVKEFENTTGATVERLHFVDTQGSGSREIGLIPYRNIHAEVRLPL